MATARQAWTEVLGLELVEAQGSVGDALTGMVRLPRQKMGSLYQGSTFH